MAPVPPGLDTPPFTPTAEPPPSNNAPQPMQGLRNRSPLQEASLQKPQPVRPLPFTPPPAAQPSPSAPQPLSPSRFASGAPPAALEPARFSRRGTTVEELNWRFFDHSESSDLAKAGVLVHTFDNTESQDGFLWKPCSEDDWCAQFSNRLSASIINEDIRSMYAPEAGGVVLSPTASTVLCSYLADGGTMNKFCLPPAPPGCVPGCADGQTSMPNWCNPKTHKMCAGKLFLPHHMVLHCLTPTFVLS